MKKMILCEGTPRTGRIQSLKRGSKEINNKVVKQRNDGLPKCCCLDVEV